MKKGILLFCIVFFTHTSVNGQTRAEILRAKKLYCGTWINKKEKRYLRFSFDNDAAYVTVNDWVGNSHINNSDAMDAYRAYVKGDRLIMPSDNDHHGASCEVYILNKDLVFECNEVLNSTGDRIGRNKYGNRTLFKKVKR